MDFAQGEIYDNVSEKANPSRKAEEKDPILNLQSGKTPLSTGCECGYDYLSAWITVLTCYWLYLDLVKEGAWKIPVIFWLLELYLNNSQLRSDNSSAATRSSLAMGLGLQFILKEDKDVLG